MELHGANVRSVGNDFKLVRSMLEGLPDGDPLRRRIRELVNERDQALDDEDARRDWHQAWERCVQLARRNGH